MNQQVQHTEVINAEVVNSYSDMFDKNFSHQCFHTEYRNTRLNKYESKEEIVTALGSLKTALLKMVESESNDVKFDKLLSEINSYLRVAVDIDGRGIAEALIRVANWAQAQPSGTFS